MTLAIESAVLEVLAAGVMRPEGDEEAGARWTRVDTARAALLALRARPIDLLVTAATVEGTPCWPFVERVRRVRPGLRWWLIAPSLGPADEVRARSLGVARIVSRLPRPALACLPKPRDALQPPPVVAEVPPRPCGRDP